MKHCLFFLLFFIVYLCSSGQGFEWQRSAKGSELLKDHENNLYVFAQGNSTINVTKFNPDGVVLWISNIISGNAKLNAFKIDPDNNLVLVGNLMGIAVCGSHTIFPVGETSFFIIKISPSLAVLNVNVYGGSGETTANDIFITKTGEYLICGGYKEGFIVNGTLIPGDTVLNCFLIKLDNEQNVQWYERAMQIGQSYCTLNEVLETEPGNYYLLATMYGCVINWKGFICGNSGVWLIKLDKNRNPLWGDYIDYPAETANLIQDLQEHNDTAYLKTYYHSVHFDSYSSISMWNPEGGKKEVYFPSGTIGYQIFNNGVYTSSGNQNFHDHPCRRVQVLSTALFSFTASVDSVRYTTGFFDIQIIDERSFYATGIGDNFGSAFVGKYNFTFPELIKEKEISNATGIYPNPSSGIFRLKLNPRQSGQRIAVRNTAGISVHEEFVADGEESHILDLRNLRNGMYLICISSPEGTETWKILIE